MATLQERTQALFNGYPNTSRTTVKEFLDYIFGLAPDTTPTFDTLAVTGASTLTGAVTMGSTLSVLGASTLTGGITTAGTLSVAGSATLQNVVVMQNNVTLSNASSLLTVHGIATLKKAVTIEKTMNVGELATFVAGVNIGGDLSLSGDAEVFGEITAGGAVTTGVVVQLGADPDMNLAVTEVGGGKELYLVNANAGGQVIIGGGSGSGTGITQIGIEDDQIGFFNEGIAAVKQTLPAAAPADEAAMIAEWQTFKTKIAAYNFFALT